MTVRPPSGLLEWQASAWLLAALDGFTCARQGGHQEQNPYDVWEPLFDAWHAGWVDACGEATPEELRAMTSRVNRYTDTTYRAERASWTRRILRFREHCDSQSSGSTLTGG